MVTMRVAVRVAPCKPFHREIAMLVSPLPCHRQCSSTSTSSQPHQLTGAPTASRTLPALSVGAALPATESTSSSSAPTVSATLYVPAEVAVSVPSTPGRKIGSVYGGATFGRTFAATFSGACGSGSGGGVVLHARVPVPRAHVVCPAAQDRT